MDHLPGTTTDILLNLTFFCFDSQDEILRVLARKVDQNKRIDVRIIRSELLWEGLRQLKRKKTLDGVLKVLFLGEEGVDTGGPRKEFLTCKLIYLSK